MIQHTTFAFGLALTTAAFAGESISIDRLAPQNTAILVHLDDADAAISKLEATPLWNLHDHPAFAEATEEAQDDLPYDLDEVFEELGIEDESDVPQPSGTFGFAIYPGRNPDTGMPILSMMAVADYGDDADKVAELIVKGMAYAEREGNLRYEELELGDRKGHSMWPIEPDGQVDIDLDDDEWDPDPFAGMLPDVDSLFSGMDQVHYVREGSHFVLSTNKQALADALAAFDGSGDRLAAVESYQSMIAPLGDVDGRVVVSVPNAISLMGSDDGMNMVAMFQPMIASILGRVDGIAFGASVDEGENMVTMPFHVYMPHGKTGLSGLMDTQTPRGDLPRFVGAQTVSYSSMNFEFSGLSDWFAGVVQTNPMLQMQMAEMLPAISSLMETLSESLENQIHTVQTMTRPVTTESVQEFTAIGCRDAEAFESAIGQTAAEMGMASRDFLGNRIYTLDMGGMMPMGMPMGPSMNQAVGIGGGYVIVGGEPAVEEALRALSRDDGDLLSTDDSFEASVAGLDDDVVGWGYTSTVDAMEGSMISGALAQKQMMEQLAAQFGEDEMMAEMQDELQAEVDRVKSFDYDAVREALGPTVWQIRSIESGFAGDVRLLSPSATD